MKVAFQFVVVFAHQAIMPIVPMELVMKNENVIISNVQSLINGQNGANAVSHVVAMENNLELDTVLLATVTIVLENLFKLYHAATMPVPNSETGLNGVAVLSHVEITGLKDEEDFVQLVLLVIVMAMLLKQTHVVQANVRITTTGLNGLIVHEHVVVEIDLELEFVHLEIHRTVDLSVHQWKMSVVQLKLVHHGDFGHNGTHVQSAVVLD